MTAPELEVHRPMNGLPHRRAAGVVEIVVSDDADIRDRERFDEPKVCRVPLRRAGAREVTEVHEEERLELGHLSYELPEDPVGSRVGPRA
jgi:hypothetical protein